MFFDFTDNTPGFIDIGQCLSVVNRRMYRQGMLYGVESFEWRTNIAKASIEISAVSNTWITFNAWVKGLALWNKMNRQSGIRKPKWHDFKVGMNAAHTAAHAPTGACGNEFPRDATGSFYASGGMEWVYSQYVSPDPAGGSSDTEKCCHFLGDDSAAANLPIGSDGSLSLIQGYADTRVTVGAQEPDVPGDASLSWQSHLFDDGTTSSDIDTHLESFNDNPPYAHGADIQGGDDPIYPGGSASASGGVTLGKMRPIDTETLFGPGGDVPCGLLFVEPSAAGKLIVTVGGGPYNGVAAMPMQDVKT